VAGEFFVDTSAWYPILDPTHPQHATVVGPYRARLGQRRRVVTTNLVVAEANALLLRREGRKAALVALDSIEKATDVLVHSTGTLEAIARRDWIERYADQDFSLADAVSFAVMRERRIEEVLTLDHHFAAAGFRVVPGA
jgi:predicted nucleic acid-binding protein